MLEKISNIFPQRITYEGKFLKSFGVYFVCQKWYFENEFIQQIFVKATKVLHYVH